MRVLELSDTEGAAAFAGKLFARWGHEVIKVESPARPAPERALDIYLNGAKRRFTADVRDAASRASLDALASTCDILVTDAGASETIAHNLLYKGSEAGPRVAVSITPFGLAGPYATAKATPATLLALGGYTYFMGEPDRSPLTMPGNYVYYQAGSYAYVAALASALGGAGGAATRTTIEVSMLETLVSLHQMTDTRWIDGKHIRARHGSSMEVVCNTMLPVKDGWAGYSVNPNFWEPFALMMGHPEVADPDHLFGTGPSRTAHADEVYALMIDAFKDKTAEEVFVEGQETWRVPVGRLSNLAQVMADRHLREREFFRPLLDASGEASGLVTPGSPFRFTGEPYPVERLPLESSVLGPQSSVLSPAASAPPPPEAEGRGGGEGRPPSTVHSALSTQHSVRRPSAPLRGIRVLDLTRIWSGPVAGRILGDLGADVIKIEEAVGRGVASIPFGNPGYQEYQGDGPWEPWNHQSLFNKLNRNHRSLCVDLKKPEGRDLFLKLVAVSDVVLENFSLRAMPSLGLGYEQLRAAKPDIISVPMPAFGRTGPYKNYIGLGPSIEPLAGIPSIMGYPGGGPMATAKAIPDAVAAMASAAAVLTALERRARTGLGCEIDLSQHEGAVACIGEYFIERQLSGEEPERIGNGHPVHSPHGIYRCAGDDHWIALAARDDAEWAALCAVAGQGWGEDVMFGSIELRRQYRIALDAAIEAWTSQHDKFALMAKLMEAGVPAGAVHKAPEYLADPHLAERGYFPDLRHPETGPQRYDGSPLVFATDSATDSRGTRGYDEWLPPPKLGEHNWEIVRDLAGMERPEYDRLVAAGVLMDRPPG